MSTIADALKNGSPEDIERQTLETEKATLRRRQQAKREVATELRGPVPALTAFELSEFVTNKFPARKPLLYRGNSVIFREGHIGEIYAIRGVGKSWLIATLALVAAVNVKALGFHCSQPSRVLLIDGEMGSEELQERFVNLCLKLNVDPQKKFGSLLPGLTILGADWQDDYLPRLDTPEGQAAVEPFIDRADLIFIDNRSSLFDSEGEKDPTAWQPAQDWLLSLRRRGKGIMLAHHGNRQGGARGISKAEDPMNLLLKLSRPDDYSSDQGARFVVEFDKARGVFGAATVPFIAALTESGWQEETMNKGNSSGRQDSFGSSEATA